MLLSLSKTQWRRYRMKNVHKIHTDVVASITSLKRDPMGTIYNDTGSQAVAILNRNQPAFYCITPELFEHFLELEENVELAKIVQERKKEGKFIKVNIDDL